MKALVRAIGILAIGMGVWGLAAPESLMEFGRSLRGWVTVGLAGALRVAFGLILIRAARLSRTPRTFSVVGALLVALGIVTFFAGAEASRELFRYWAAHGLATFRAAAGMAAAFGVFLVYSISG